MAEATTIAGVRSDRALILVTLIGLAGAAWAVLVWQSSDFDDKMSLTMGMSAPLFIALWIAMMVAIMYPTASPMILMFAKVHTDRQRRGDAFVPTWIFAGSYLAVWSVSGIAAYGLAVAGDRLADESEWLMDNAARIGGGLLVLAGVYQLTPLKDVCLSKCRSPVAFLMNSWRDGVAGAVRMGIEHGAYCLGCCWLLFLILFPLGMMSIGILALVTILIFAEKVLPIGRQVAYAAGAGMIAYGAVVVFVPEALPMYMDDSTHMEMDGMPAGEMSEDGSMPSEMSEDESMPSEMSGMDEPMTEMDMQE